MQNFSNTFCPYPVRNGGTVSKKAFAELLSFGIRRIRNGRVGRWRGLSSPERTLLARKLGSA